MADDAFALSPMSARASLPSEADYGAIRDAFRETARGRWFLDEYARRNRNADTTQVLDAVARIEAGLASRAPSATPTTDSIRDALLDAIRPLIAEARAAADAAMMASTSAETIAGGRRAARIIREISWSLRETGTDPRRCNILDTQLLALDAVHDQADADMRPALIGEVFDDLILRIEEIASNSGVRTPVVRPEPVERVGANTPDVRSEMKSAEPVAVVADDRSSLPTDDELAADEAMLHLIAMEMTAPEGDDVDDFARDEQSKIIVPTPIAVSTTPVAVPTIPVSVAVLPVEAPSVASPSLGAALIANGIVAQPRRSTDALAPFRRMSQIDKIAFFS